MQPMRLTCCLFLMWNPNSFAELSWAISVLVKINVWKTAKRWLDCESRSWFSPLKKEDWVSEGSGTISSGSWRIPFKPLRLSPSSLGLKFLRLIDCKTSAFIDWTELEIYIVRFKILAIRIIRSRLALPVLEIISVGQPFAFWIEAMCWAVSSSCSYIAQLESVIQRAALEFTRAAM